MCRDPGTEGCEYSTVSGDGAVSFFMPYPSKVQLFWQICHRGLRASWTEQNPLFKPALLSPPLKVDKPKCGKVPARLPSAVTENVTVFPQLVLFPVRFFWNVAPQELALAVNVLENQYRVDYSLKSNDTVFFLFEGLDSDARNKPLDRSNNLTTATLARWLKVIPCRTESCSSAYDCTTLAPLNWTGECP